MIMKQRLLFVGVGQAGGNVVNSLEKKGYYCTYINTSNEDLSTLETDDVNKFHIPKAQGCSKDKDKAFLFVKNHYESMLAHINENYPNQDIVFFVFSTGGGTGAGISPILLDMLSSANQNKYYGAIAIMPSKRESIKCLMNSIDTYSKLTDLRFIKSLFLIDNNKGSILDINKKFVNLFDRFINITNPDSRGIIDNNELETLLTARGVSVVLDTKKTKEEQVYLNNEIFVDFPRGCGYVGLSCKSNPNQIQALIEEEVGFPDDYFIGYNDTSDIAIITEMNYPDEMVIEMQQIIKDKKEQKTNNREGAVKIKNPFASSQSTGYKTSEKPKEKAVDYNNILNKYF